jgi:hypothetical protein
LYFASKGAQNSKRALIIVSAIEQKNGDSLWGAVATRQAAMREFHFTF